MRTDILKRKNEILQWISEERPKCYICQQLGCKQETLNSYLKKMNIEYAGQQAKKVSKKALIDIDLQVIILIINILLALIN